MEVDGSKISIKYFFVSSVGISLLLPALNGECGSLSQSLFYPRNSLSIFSLENSKDN